MSVSEYALDVDKSVSEILNLCKKLELSISNEDDMLSDDDIIMLDNELASLENEEEVEDEVPEESEEDGDLEEDYEEELDDIIEEKNASKKKKQNKVETSSKNDYREKRKEMIICIILCILVSLLIMVVSCRFRYGTLVIGTGSMTGTINKGDIIIYERYEKEELEIGEIIVFKTENVFVIHRIIDKKSVGEEIRYYTKGDANQQEDKGFRTQKNIVGIVKGKIPYIGKITLLLNDIINK